MGPRDARRASTRRRQRARDAFLDAGHSLVDTAPAYGRAEQMVGGPRRPGPGREQGPRRRDDRPGRGEPGGGGPARVAAPHAQSTASQASCCTMRARRPARTRGRGRSSTPSGPRASRPAWACPSTRRRRLTRPSIGWAQTSSRSRATRWTNGSSSRAASPTCLGRRRGARAQLVPQRCPARRPGDPRRVARAARPGRRPAGRRRPRRGRDGPPSSPSPSRERPPVRTQSSSEPSRRTSCVRCSRPGPVLVRQALSSRLPASRSWTGHACPRPSCQPSIRAAGRSDGAVVRPAGKPAGSRGRGGDQDG